MLHENYEELLTENFDLIEKKADYFIGRFSSVPLIRDELIQEGRLALLKALNNYSCNFKTSFRTYFSKILDNSFADLLRSEQKKNLKSLSILSLDQIAEFENSEEIFFDSSWFSEDPLDIIIRRFTSEQIRKACSLLSRRQQTFIYFRFGFDGEARSRKQTADEFDLSLRMVEKLEKEILSALRSELNSQ